jgi:Flp pilus assembly pilin Flp
VILRNIRDILDSYIKKNDGATAIEMAFIALPLCYFMIGIIEIALMFTTSIVLEGATSDASRLVRTGQVQQAGADGQSMFEDALCDAMSVLASCDDISYEVVQIGDGWGGAAGNSANFDDDGGFQSQGFDPGGVSDVVLIRAVYDYPLKTPIISDFFGDPGKNTRLMMSTIVLQTEPYDFEDD